MKLLLWILLFSRILRIFWNRRNKVTYSYAFACIVGINLMSKKRLKKYSYRLVKFHYCLIDIREEIASKNYNYWLDSKLILKKYQYLFFLIYEWKWSNHEIHEILIDKLIRSSLCFLFTKHASSFFLRNISTYSKADPWQEIGAKRIVKIFSTDQQLHFNSPYFCSLFMDTIGG